MRNLIIPTDTSSYFANDLARTQRNTLSQCLSIARTIPNPERLIFSHVTALRILGISVPQRISSSTYVHVCSPHQSERVRAGNGILASHVWAHEGELLPVLQTMACAAPLTVWAQLSMYLPLPDIVCLADSIMRKNSLLKWNDKQDFEAYLKETTNFKGRRKCIAALPLMQANTDSPPETYLRLFLQSLNLDGLQVNGALRGESGRVWDVDIVHPPSRTGYEYDGWYHNTSEQQWHRDPEKRRDLEDAGWHITNVTSRMLNNPEKRAELAASINANVISRMSR